MKLPPKKVRVFDVEANGFLRQATKVQIGRAHV